MSLLEAISPTTVALLERQQMIDETAQALGDTPAVRADLETLTPTRLAEYHRQALNLGRCDEPTERTTPTPTGASAVRTLPGEVAAL